VEDEEDEDDVQGDFNSQFFLVDIGEKIKWHEVQVSREIVQAGSLEETVGRVFFNLFRPSLSFFTRNVNINPLSCLLPPQSRLLSHGC
jgi:hypothetical protein